MPRSLRLFCLFVILLLAPSIFFAHARQCLPAGPRIALTFDDGPWYRYTPTVLQVLLDRDVPATFFMVGQRARAAPDLVRIVQEGGHEIGLHSDSHANLRKLSPVQVANQMSRNLHALENACPGVKVASWRAPYGEIPTGSARMSLDAAIDHRPHVLWTLDTLDWQHPSQDIFLARLSNWKDGSIILMHEHTPATQSWLAEALDEMMARGVVFVRVSELDLPVCPVESLDPAEVDDEADYYIF